MAAVGLLTCHADLTAQRGGEQGLIPSRRAAKEELVEVDGRDGRIGVECGDGGSAGLNGLNTCSGKRDRMCSGIGKDAGVAGGKRDRWQASSGRKIASCRPERQFSGYEAEAWPGNSVINGIPMNRFDRRSTHHGTDITELVNSMC